MAVPWLAVGNLVLKNLDTILAVVVPGFTRKKADAAANQAELFTQQIAELQSASATNTGQIKELAAQLKSVVTALEDAALAAQAEREKARTLAVFGIGLGIVALGTAIASIYLR